MSAQSSTVAVGYNPADGITKVLLPIWMSAIEVVARTDGRNEVTLEVTRRFGQEQWMMVSVAGTPSTLVAWCNLGGGQKLCEESAVRARVLVPPGRVGVVEATAFDPDKG